MRKMKLERGLLSLEASIAVSIFIFFTLFLYSFFVVFEARNQIAHVILATTNSMSLDSYQNEKLGAANNISKIFYDIYKISATNDNGFVNEELWSKVEKENVDGIWNGKIYATQTGGDTSVTDPDEYGKQAVISSLFREAIEERFIAYLAGGDRTEANRILKRYHIVGGLDGLDFSGSYISSGKLYISVRYTMEYEFNLWGLGQVEFEQSACSKIWQ